MVFFLPVMGSKRATALARGVRLYRAMRSCEAEGFDGRCSEVRMCKTEEGYVVCLGSISGVCGRERWAVRGARWAYR